MPFINKKLGNAFLIKAADSSKNQEFYFSNHIPHVTSSFTASLPDSYIEATQPFTSSGGDIYIPLTETGVENLREIGNANIDTININRNIMPTLDPSVSEVSYYGWSDPIQSNFSHKGHYVALRDMAQDSNGNLYVTAYRKKQITDSDFFWGTYLYKKESEDLILLDEFDAKILSSVDFSSFGIAINQTNGDIYVAGPSGSEDSSLSSGIIRKSNVTSSFSWTTLDTGTLTGSAASPTKATFTQIAIDLTGSVYAVGCDGDNAFVVSSSDDGTTWGRHQHTGSGASTANCFADIAIDFNDIIYVVGAELGTAQQGVAISSSDRGLIWSEVDHLNTGSLASFYRGVDTTSDGEVYFTGYAINVGESSAITRWSSNGASASFSEVDLVGGSGEYHWGFDIAVDSNDSVNLLGVDSLGAAPGDNIIQSWVRARPNNTASFEYTDLYLSSSAGNRSPLPSDLFVSREDTIYSLGYFSLAGIAPPSSGEIYSYLRHGQLTANSASIGSRTLSTSVNLVKTTTPGVEKSYFELKNIAEFPHSFGLFQMKNMVLGTTTSGKIGPAEDDLIQIRRLGSFVTVMWPKQAEQSSLVKGLADFSAGERAGKLATQFEPGEVVDVKEFDHVALYCYLSKEASGSIDDIDIKIERKPLKDLAFATDQTIEYSTSGSKSLATLRDLHYRKEINYGDLSIREIGYPIDIPLTNVKELRISARQKFGQEEENKNFIVWGRFIKSEEET